jgi:hypothetical protein
VIGSSGEPHARRPLAATAASKEGRAMAKGQKKSNREVRKPKADKPKPVAAGPSFLSPITKKK